jgi:hypothetical protein
VIFIAAFPSIGLTIVFGKSKMPSQSRFNTVILGIALLVVAGAVSLWAASILRTPPHSDVLWLIEALSRWLSDIHLLPSYMNPTRPIISSHTPCLILQAK